MVGYLRSPGCCLRLYTIYFGYYSAMIIASNRLFRKSPNRRQITIDDEFISIAESIAVSIKHVPDMIESTGDPGPKSNPHVLLLRKNTSRHLYLRCLRYAL